MNFSILESYIQFYKDNFELINRQELYKWKAVKHFQKKWNINAENFRDMLAESLSKTYNLLDSGQYFPKRMLLSYAQDNPELIKSLFEELYDEKNDINDRIKTFRYNIKQLNKKYKVANDYQDHRAVIVYLALKYPNSYYFYKQKMFKTFLQKIDYNYKSIAGNIENITQYNFICNIIRNKLSEDQELLRLHNFRLTQECYIDTNLNILTQDFIYAVTQYLNTIEINDFSEIDKKNINVTNINSSSIQIAGSSIDFVPHTTNYIQNGIENKRLGDLGELFVLNYEREKMRGSKRPDLEKKVDHVAATFGDGLGYDILSFDEEFNKKFIEVKTTKGNLNSIFFISRKEMEKSKIEKDNYYLYRVFNFDETTLIGDIQIISGDISNLCQEPLNYKVKMI